MTSKVYSNPGQSTAADPSAAQPANAAVEQPADTDQSGEPSIARLLGEIVSDAQQLVRKEFELAKHEVRVEVDKARDGAISLGIGAGVTAIGGVFLLLMVVHALVAAFGWPLWLSYLVVGGLITVVGVVLLMMGLSRVQTVDPTPRQTVDNVRKDVEWIKERNPSNVK